MKLRRRAIFLLLAAAAMWPAPGSAQSSDLRIRLYAIHSPQEARIDSRGQGARVRLCPQCAAKPLAASLSFRASGNHISLIMSGAKQKTASLIRISGQFHIEVPGSAPLDLRFPLEIRVDGGRLSLVVEMPVEEYVAAVLAGEGSVFASGESLMAMAVAARTYAARFRGRHSAEGFDFCDTTHCQDLRLATVNDRLRAAAEATEAELLWYDGRPAATYYHRNCGGVTEDARRVWPGEGAPYLRQQQDPFCVAAGGAEWQTVIAKADLARALNSTGVRVPTHFGSLEIFERSPSGRALLLRLTGSGGAEVRAADLRFAVGRLLGWEKIRSDLYELADLGPEVRFTGRGAGHGVGLCQIGAAQMGQQGRKYAEILAFYYPGTKLGITAQGLPWHAAGGERVDLLVARRDDERLLPLAEKLLAEAEARTGWQAKTRPQVRIYPSVEVYRNATGQPGWVAASTRGRVVRIEPPEVLRAAGALEATLLHEFVHLLIESRAHASLPLWFREGLALALANGFGGKAATVKFESDAALERALRQPRSQAELRSAYAAARARVTELLEQQGKATVLGWVASGLPAVKAVPQGR